jgi:hypothetical protein
LKKEQANGFPAERPCKREPWPPLHRPWDMAIELPGHQRDIQTHFKQMLRRQQRLKLSKTREKCKFQPKQLKNSTKSNSKTQLWDTHLLLASGGRALGGLARPQRAARRRRRLSRPDSGETGVLIDGVFVTVVAVDGEVGPVERRRVSGGFVVRLGVSSDETTAVEDAASETQPEALRRLAAAALDNAAPGSSAGRRLRFGAHLQVWTLHHSAIFGRCTRGWPPQASDAATFCPQSASICRTTRGRSLHFKKSYCAANITVVSFAFKERELVDNLAIFCAALLESCVNKARYTKEMFSCGKILSVLIKNTFYYTNYCA